MLNPYFKSRNEGTAAMKDIIHKQTAEVIQQNGRDMFYITRKTGNLDHLFGEDYAGTFEGHFKIEMYPIGGTKYGDTDMLSKFGLEARDEAMISVSGNRFREVTKMKYPYEGDLIFDPLSRRLFELKHIENEDIFYPLETLPQYVMKCELFEYSHEKMETGVREVDAVDGIDNFTDENGETSFEVLEERENDSINDALMALNGSSQVVDKWDTESVNPATVDDWDMSNPFG